VLWRATADSLRHRNYPSSSWRQQKLTSFGDLNRNSLEVIEKISGWRRSQSLVFETIRGLQSPQQFFNQEDLGGSLSTAPTASWWILNRLDVFYAGQNDRMWHRTWDGAW
jgi:hypothetical protein